MHLSEAVIALSVKTCIFTLTKRRASSGSNLFDIQMVFMNFFRKS